MKWYLTHNIDNVKKNEKVMFIIPFFMEEKQVITMQECPLMTCIRSSTMSFKMLYLMMIMSYIFSES